ncbi:hypothetical protein [Streptomyces sp. I05A-00742]|uniref:hypothetical protein n=1 Tax=Streptomyces sp. I05A-00742 TaxID=2732853 RepID=UPI001BB17CB3|nr:hypothetical protein [Streptomyces sp. I05A-00742]
MNLSVWGRMAFVMMTLMASLATAIVYGIGGGLVFDRAFQLGTLIAIATLLERLFGPITQLSGMQQVAQTVVVSFSRVFELLDLKPLIQESAPRRRATGRGGRNQLLSRRVVTYRRHIENRIHPGNTPLH